jgi:enterochelin esterase family protein
VTTTRAVEAPLSRTVEEALAQAGPERVLDLARASGGPIVEESSLPGRCLVTFVHADESGDAGAVGVVCPVFERNFSLLARLGETNVFAATYAVPATARVKYGYLRDPSDRVAAGTLDAVLKAAADAQPDPFNPHTDVTVFGEFGVTAIDTVLTLPAAPPHRWSEPRDGVEAGAVEELEVPSSLLGAGRTVAVYTPPGFDPSGGPYRAVVVLDGLHEWWGAPTTFDNLLADGVAAPFVGVQVGTRGFVSRQRELAGNPDFVRFLTDELLPLLASSYGVAERGHVVAGTSVGGLGAAFAGVTAPHHFSDVVCISGAFHLTVSRNPFPWKGESTDRRWVIEAYERADDLPRRVYLAAGTYEAYAALDFVADATRLAEVLEDQGVEVRLDVGDTAHDTLAVRGYFGEGLAWLLAG